MGFCAEHAAIAAMVTAGEYRIDRIVAVWKDDGDTYVLSPCGRCRELIYRLHEDNIDTTVVLDRDEFVSLRELLPKHDWFKKQERESE